LAHCACRMRHRFMLEFSVEPRKRRAHWPVSGTLPRPRLAFPMPTVLPSLPSSSTTTIATIYCFLFVPGGRIPTTSSFVRKLLVRLVSSLNVGFTLSVLPIYFLNCFRFWLPLPGIVGARFPLFLANFGGVTMGVLAWDFQSLHHPH
jgi:hypothetical protein